MRTFGLILAAAAVAVNGAGVAVSSSGPTRVNGRWPRAHCYYFGLLAHTRTWTTSLPLSRANHSAPLFRILISLQHDDNGNIVITPSEGTTVFM